MYGGKRRGEIKAFELKNKTPTWEKGTVRKEGTEGRKKKTQKKTKRTKLRTTRNRKDKKHTQNLVLRRPLN